MTEGLILEMRNEAKTRLGRRVTLSNGQVLPNQREKILRGASASLIRFILTIGSSLSASAKEFQWSRYDSGVCRNATTFSFMDGRTSGMAIGMWSVIAWPIN